jgi:NADP-dependent 3-hydroxy acid dehydrogenase YdfG
MANQNENASNKIWFITGASRGFGQVWTEAALKRGDKVAATARKLASIADLNEKYGANVLTLELDVTKPEQVKTAVNQAYHHFGRLDVVFNFRLCWCCHQQNTVSYHLGRKKIK